MLYIKRSFSVRTDGVSNAKSPNELKGKKMLPGPEANRRPSRYKAVVYSISAFWNGLRGLEGCMIF